MNKKTKNLLFLIALIFNAFAIGMCIFVFLKVPQGKPLAILGILFFGYGPIITYFGLYRKDKQKNLLDRIVYFVLSILFCLISFYILRDLSPTPLKKLISIATLLFFGSAAILILIGKKEKH